MSEKVGYFAGLDDPKLPSDAVIARKLIYSAGAIEVLQGEGDSSWSLVDVFHQTLEPCEDEELAVSLIDGLVKYNYNAAKDACLDRMYSALMFDDRNVYERQILSSPEMMELVLYLKKMKAREGRTSAFNDWPDSVPAE